MPSPPAPSSRSASIAALATERGAQIVREAGLRGTATVESKGLPGDYVTDVDLASEEAIIALLARESPDIPVHGEEGGGQTGDRYWVVDPLDGTTNFSHGFPAVGVSVALIEHGPPNRRKRVRAVPAHHVLRRPR